MLVACALHHIAIHWRCLGASRGASLGSPKELPAMRCGCEKLEAKLAMGCES